MISSMRPYLYAALLALAGLGTAVVIFVIKNRPVNTPLSGSVTNISIGNIPYAMFGGQYTAPSEKPPGELPAGDGLLPVAGEIPSTFWGTTGTQATLPAANQGSDDDFTAILAILMQEYAPYDASGSITGSQTNTPLALHQYGNASGAIIEAFERAHPDMAQTANTWLQTKGSNDLAMQMLAANMEKTGNALASLNAPSSVASANSSLAASFVQAAARLYDVLAATNQIGLVAAMSSYNSAADSVLTNFSSLAGLFVASNVSFTADEPGALFY